MGHLIEPSRHPEFGMTSTTREFKPMYKIMKIWKTTSIEEHLNEYQLLIAGNQENLLCNNCRSTKEDFFCC